MLVREAIHYCYQNRDKFIRKYDTIDEGCRQFDCLIELLKEGTITPDQMSDYGMDYD